MSGSSGFGSAGFHERSDSDASDASADSSGRTIDGAQLSMTVEDERFAAITATLDDALSGLREVPSASLSNADRRAVYLRLDVAVRSLTGISHTILNELIEQRGFDGFDGSIPAALSNMVRITGPAASLRVRLAKDLGRTCAPSGEIREPDLPHTAEAQRQGCADDAHVTVIRDFLRHLPLRVDPDARANAEEQLAGLTPQFRPDELAAAARRLAGYLDPDGEQDKEKNRARTRSFTLGRQGADLMTPGKFLADPETAAALLTFFGKFARPGMLNSDDITAVTDPDGDLSGSDAPKPEWDLAHPSWDAPEPPTRSSGTNSGSESTGSANGSGTKTSSSANGNDASASSANGSGTNAGAAESGSAADAHDDHDAHAANQDTSAANDAADGSAPSADPDIDDVDDAEFGDGSLFAPEPSEESLSGELAKDTPGSWGAQARQNPRAGRDTRSQGQRQHDALKFLLRQTLASGVKTLGTHRGLPVTVVVSIGHADYQAATGMGVSSAGPWFRCVMRSGWAPTRIIIWRSSTTRMAGRCI